MADVTSIQRPDAFRSAEEAALVHVLRTGEQLVQSFSEVLRPYGLSFPQYGALRALRDAGEGGLACGEVAERLVTRDPDVTRLVDRLEARGLVARGREPRDRRVVKIRLTQQGLRIADELEPRTARLLQQLFLALSGKKLQRLINLLERVRVRQTLSQ